MKKKTSKKAAPARRRTQRPLLLIHSAADVAAARAEFQRTAAGLKKAYQNGSSADIRKAHAAFQWAFEVHRQMS